VPRVGIRGNPLPEGNGKKNQQNKSRKYRRLAVTDMQEGNHEAVTKKNNENLNGRD